MNEAEEFATELDAVCRKYLRKSNLVIADYLIQLSFIYATLCRMGEQDATEEELIEIRDNAVGIIADQIYADGLLCKEGTTH